MSINGESYQVLGTGSYVVGDLDNRFNIPIEIGKYTSIAHGVKILGNQHALVIHRKIATTYPFDAKMGLPFPSGDPGIKPIKIGSDVWIGAYTSVMSGVIIGDGAIIGACAVIAKDVPPYAVVVGNPGQIKKYRYTEDQIKKLLRIKWWDWSEAEIAERYPSLEDIDLLLKTYDIGSQT